MHWLRCAQKNPAERKSIFACPQIINNGCPNIRALTKITHNKDGPISHFLMHCCTKLTLADTLLM